MSNSDIFLQVFGGKSPEKDAASSGKSVSPDERARLFADAFKAEPKAAPKPHLGQNWRINNTKARGLSFTEQYALGELADVPYRDLPDWVRDWGYAEPSADEKQHQKEQLEETGLTRIRTPSRIACKGSWQWYCWATISSGVNGAFRGSQVGQGRRCRLFTWLSGDTPPALITRRSFL